MKQETVKKVREYFGLNIYEAKVWLALLSKGIVSAGETAEISGVPRSRTYDVLESLAKRGFAVVKIGKPVKYIAIKPETILEKMKMNVLSDAQERVKSLSNLKGSEEYVELEQLHKTGIAPIKSEDISGFLKGRPNVIAKVREVLGKAEKEAAIYTSVSDFEDKMRVLLPTIEDLTKKEIKVKIALSGDEERIRKLNSKYDLKARKMDNKSRLFIADKKEVLFMISHENAEEEIAIWLSSPFFSESLGSMLELHFKK